MRHVALSSSTSLRLVHVPVTPFDCRRRWMCGSAARLERRETTLHATEPVSRMGSDEAFREQQDEKRNQGKLYLNHRERHKHVEGGGFRFGQRRGDHMLERGLTAEAKRVAAEADEAYRLAHESLTKRPGGLTGGEEVKRIDSVTGEEVTFRRYAAPFGETFVASSQERFALRGQVGQLSNTTKVGSWELPEARETSNTSLLAERRIQHIIDSPQLPLTDKIDLLGNIAKDVFAQQLPLQPKVWTSLFTIWGQGHAAPLVEAYQHKQLRLMASGAGGSQPQPLPTATTSSDEERETQLLETTQSLKCIGWMKEAYLHMRSGFTAPTSAVMEAMMGALALSGSKDNASIHLAHRILLDADKFVVLPTRTTYAAYFDICNRCELMHFAVKRFADAIDHLHIEPDAAMATALLRGLSENGLVEEAVAMLARLEKIDADVQLLNTSMEVLLLSNDAHAVLAAYDAVVRHQHSIQPSSETFTLMLLACERLADWTPVTTILTEMQFYKVKGDAQCLNLLLKGLLLQKLNAYAHQLYLTMRLKRVDVWPAVEAALPPSVKAAPLQLSRKGLRRLTDARKSLRGNEPLALTKQVVADAQYVQTSVRSSSLPRSGAPDAKRAETVVAKKDEGARRTGSVMIDLDELLAATEASEGESASHGRVMPRKRQGGPASAHL